MAIFLLSLTELATAASVASDSGIPSNYQQSSPLRTQHYIAKRQILLVKHTEMSQRPSLEEYLERRQQVVDIECQSNFESDVTLTKHEQLANTVIMAAKQAELDEGLANPHSFKPARHFFEVLNEIRESKLFKIIQHMPKGGILHAHDTALVSTNFIVTLTYREHLWQCNNTVTKKIVNFRFSREAPETSESNLKWVRVADERSRLGKIEYDAHMRSLFTLFTEDPRSAYRDINDMWAKFMSLFILLEPIATYAPVWRDYFKQALTEALQDNVQYLEFRGLLPQLYDLDRSNYTKSENVQIYVDTLEEFKRANPDFIGSKFVYAPLRLVPDTTMDEYISNVQDLHESYPDFIAGFDLVGQEDMGRPLLDFTEKLLSLPDSIKFFLHAGETNWFGSSVDENLVCLNPFLIFSSTSTELMLHAKLYMFHNLLIKLCCLIA